MVKSKLALILDSLFVSSLITLLVFLWLRHEIKNAILLRFFLILMFLLLFVLILFLYYKFNNKKFLHSTNEKFLKNCILHLQVCGYEEYSNYLCKLFSCNKITNYFYDFQDKFLYINLKSSLNSYDFFEAQEQLLNHANASKKLIFIYSKKEKDFDELISLSPLNISCFSNEIILKLMTKKNFYPIEKEAPPQITFKQKIKNTFLSKTQGVTKSHFKEIFFTSISLLFLSLVAPFSKYYLIMGSILLIVSIISLFKKDIPKSQDDSDLFQ